MDYHHHHHHYLLLVLGGTKKSKPSTDKVQNLGGKKVNLQSPSPRFSSQQDMR